MAGEPGTCAICLQPLQTPGLSDQMLSCKHVLHEHCVAQMRRLGVNSLCPLCRREDSNLEPVDLKFAKAIEHDCRGEHAETFQLLDEILNIDPEHVNAITAMGRLYHHGHHVRRDSTTALALFQRGHSAGNVEATFYLACIYFNEWDGEHDDAKAFELFQLLARMGHPEALAYLGCMFQEGRHVEQDLIKAFSLFRQACSAGSFMAAGQLGVAYYLGNPPVQQDFAEAFELFRTAYARGDRVCAGFLGDMYWKGNGVMKDLDKARQMLKQALLCAEEVQRCGDNVTSYVSALRRKLQQVEQDQEQLNQLCAECGALAHFRCSTCKVVRYCSRQCQRKHFKLHKHSCHPPASESVSLKTPEEKATEKNAAVTSAILLSRDPSHFDQEQLFVLEFPRHSAELRDAVEEHFRDIRLALQSHGYAWEQPSGCKVSVYPCQFQAARRAIDGRSLTISHMVTSESLKPLVDMALATIPSRRRRNPRQEVVAEIDSAFVLEMRHTFLCWAPRDLSFSAVAQSTTVAHGGRNYRQATHSGM